MIEFVCILDKNQYETNNRRINTIFNVVDISETIKYSIDRDNEYFVILYSGFAIGRTKEEIMRFITYTLDYICIRFGGTSCVISKNYGDFLDLYYDFYEKIGIKSLEKDLLIPSERYDMIIESSSYIYPNDSLNMAYSENGSLEELELIPIDKNTIELFTQEDELCIVNEYTGESHTVDITIGIPTKYFNFIVLKNLENSKKNIL